MPGEIIESGVHAAKQPGCDQFKFDLLQRAAMELLSDFDFQTVLLCRRDNGICLAEFVRNWSLEQHVQPRLHSHQPNFAIRVIVDTHDADFGGSLAYEFIHVGVGRHTKTLAQPLNRVPVAAPHRNQFNLIWQGPDERPVQIIGAFGGTKNGDAQGTFVHVPFSVLIMTSAPSNPSAWAVRRMSPASSVDLTTTN